MIFIFHSLSLWPSKRHPLPSVSSWSFFFFPLFQMILTVYLSDGEQAVTEVPITPETTCRDVVEFCKEPGESGCHLAEVWRGNGKVMFKRKNKGVSGRWSHLKLHNDWVWHFTYKQKNYILCENKLFIKERKLSGTVHVYQSEFKLWRSQK